jgi:hypothetical protein
MKNYSTIKSAEYEYTFTATILGSLVPSIQNQVYIQNSPPLEISIDPFVVIPTNFNVGPSSIDAYVFSGSQLPS